MATAPEDWRILEYLAKDEEKEIDTEAIHAAFPKVGADRLDAWLTVMSEDLGLIEEVPAAPRESGGPGRRWRICDPRRRFWYDVLRDIAWEIWGQYGRFPPGSTERLADRMRSLEDAALAQLKRECGADWPEPGERARSLSRKTAPVERRAFAFSETAPGVLEGVLVPYGVPIRVGVAFDEVFEPGSLMANGLLVNVRQPVPDPRGRPLARPGKGLVLRDGPDGLRATVTLPDTIDGRRVRSRVEAGELTAFSAAFQAIGEEWPAPDRRIVRRARLVGLSLVDRPEHESPLIEEVRVRPGEPLAGLRDRGLPPE